MPFDRLQPCNDLTLLLSAYLQTLADLCLLRPSKHGREMYYINDALFAELVK